MRKLVLSMFALTSFVVLSAQTVVTHKAHALKVDEHNPMSYCEYIDAGEAGENITWDFSSLKFERSFTGYLNNPKITENGSAFSAANIELAEFDSRFYFRSDENKIEQHGYSSSDGKSQIFYSSPFIKMKYPFAYSDIYSGSYTGKYLYSGVETGEVNGSYSVEADAFGTLILSGNTTYENTLRIRTEKSYTIQFKNSSQIVNSVTYRWYNQSHRYPLLVLTSYTANSGNSNPTNYQAAYNNNAVTDIISISDYHLSLYPNPVSSSLMLEFNATLSTELSFQIFDASGRLARSFVRQINSAGRQQLDLSDELSGLYPSNYTLVIDKGGNQIKRSFTKVK